MRFEMIFMKPNSIEKCWLFKVEHEGLEKWLSGYEHWLFFERT